MNLHPVHASRAVFLSWAPNRVLPSYFLAARIQDPLGGVIRCARSPVGNAPRDPELRQRRFRSPSGSAEAISDSLDVGIARDHG
jgi:hypothetical protein